MARNEDMHSLYAYGQKTPFYCFMTALQLSPKNNLFLTRLCGHLNEHIKTIERHFNVCINQRGFDFQFEGNEYSVKIASQMIKTLFNEANEREIHAEDVAAMLAVCDKHQSDNEANESVLNAFEILKVGRKRIKTYGKNQLRYIHNLRTLPLNFAIGSAGTGKTYLAVAAAVEALEKDEVKRIVLTRPAVEAGEKLGFLPGDLTQKADPYLRPLLDALTDMLGAEQVEKHLQTNVIEVAPLAYMRGRTLNDSFMILDEAQNTTILQMKMFLTRIGFNSKAVVAGDESQIDLPHHQQSGLIKMPEILGKVPDIGFNVFTPDNVMRHSLVKDIINAFDQYNDNQREQTNKTTKMKNYG